MESINEIKKEDKNFLLDELKKTKYISTPYIKCLKYKDDDLKTEYVLWIILDFENDKLIELDADTMFNKYSIQLVVDCNLNNNLKIFENEDDDFYSVITNQLDNILKESFKNAYIFFHNEILKIKNLYNSNILKIKDGYFENVENQFEQNIIKQFEIDSLSSNLMESTIQLYKAKHIILNILPLLNFNIATKSHIKEINEFIKNFQIP